MKTDYKGHITGTDEDDEHSHLHEIKEQNAKFHEKLYKLNRSMNLLSKTVEKITKKVNSISSQNTLIHDRLVDGGSTEDAATGKFYHKEISEIDLFYSVTSVHDELKEKVEMIVPTIQSELGPTLERAISGRGARRSTSQKKANLLMKYNIGEDFLVQKAKSTMAVSSSPQLPTVESAAETADKDTIMIATSTATDKIVHNEYSTLSQEVPETIETKSLNIPPPPSPPKWTVENESLTAREVYGTPTPDFEPEESKKKKFLRRSLEGEIVKFPPV